MVRDVKGEHRRHCRELAQRLGYKQSEIWNVWGELALIIEFEQGIARPFAEHAASRHVIELFDKVGLGPPS